jgi:acetyltransferase-like isoleucine patch superfamily enzyme
MKFIYFAINSYNKLLAFSYSMLMSYKFREWGRNSRLGQGAKLFDPQLVLVGSNVRISEQAWINAKDYRGDGLPTLKIGDGTYIGRQVQINAWQSVTIGCNVLIADRVFISDADHNFKDACTPIRLQGDSFIGAVVLEDGCWLGIGSVILPGVTIGKNAVVGANAVVTKDVPSRAVVGGIPAKVIKSCAD